MNARTRSAVVTACGVRAQAAGVSYIRMNVYPYLYISYCCAAAASRCTGEMLKRFDLKRRNIMCGGDFFFYYVPTHVFSAYHRIPRQRY